jgi:membrane protease YdiL (CAAX protease family)
MSDAPALEPAPTLPAPEPAAIEPAETDPRESPLTSWSPWSAPAALIGGLLLAAVASLLVDLPALALGVKLTSSHTPAGLVIADTVVQDIAFVLAAVYCARLGGRVVRSWQFGLRRPGAGWRSAALMIGLLLVSFILLDAIWSEIVNPSKEKLLETLGTKESTALLVFSAALTCIVAPVCEEFLFRGYIFTALRNWRGTLPAAILTGIVFGGVHATSAPGADLLPLGILGFGLCLLYRYTGSLYPGMLAHSLNNSIAFAGLAGWSWAGSIPLIVGAPGAILLLIWACNRAGYFRTPDSSREPGGVGFPA